MATTKQTTKNGKQTIQVTGADGVYDAGQMELQRLSKDDAASRKVDKALEEARGKDTVRLHVALLATSVADERAQARHDEATAQAKKDHDAGTKKSDTNAKATQTAVATAEKAVLKDAAKNHKATITLMEGNHATVIDLAESNQATVVDLVQKSKAEVVRDVSKTREELLNGQAVLGEAATKAQKDAKSSFAALEKSLTSVHESISKHQESDGKAIIKMLREQQEATLDLIQTVYNDLDTKMKHFREEVADDLEKMSTNQGNQNASVRGDLNVVLSLLSDIRKDQIGRPERR